MFYMKNSDLNTKGGSLKIRRCKKIEQYQEYAKKISILERFKRNFGNRDEKYSRNYVQKCQR